MKANAIRCLVTLMLALGSAAIIGCGSGSGYSALSSGSEAPAITATGWTNGDPPEDLEGNIVVLEMFATW